MRKINDNGFTFIEFLIATCLIGIFLVFLISCAAPYANKAREAEVKANIHTIQIALERYAVDHDGAYPKMIWGGDEKSWSRVKGTGCRTMWEHEPFNGENEETAHPPLDPLVDIGYMKSYPKNPFLTEEKALERIIRLTGKESAVPGDGDPRFGFNGMHMGNVLEDPKYLWSSPFNPTRIQNTLADNGEKSNAKMINPNSKFNPLYSMGGIPEPIENHWTSELDVRVYKKGTKNTKRDTVSAFWPGQFFYRSGGAYLLPEKFISSSGPDPGMTTIWHFKYTKINRYLLGGYGAWGTKGMDVIRLTDIEGKPVNNSSGDTAGGFYYPHRNYARTSSSKIRFSSPEVFGGGGFGEMPYYPYLDPQTGDWLYGCPDGYRDGLILVLTAGAPD